MQREGKMAEGKREGKREGKSEGRRVGKWWDREAGRAARMEGLKRTLS
jgi:hypothetical protein